MAALRVHLAFVALSACCSCCMGSDQSDHDADGDIMSAVQAPWASSRGLVETNSLLMNDSRVLSAFERSLSQLAGPPPYYRCGEEACVEATSELEATLGVSYFWGPQWKYPSRGRAKFGAEFKCGVTFSATSGLSAKVVSTRNRPGECKTCEDCDKISGTWKQTAAVALTCQASAYAWSFKVSIGADLAKLIFSFSLGVSFAVGGECSDKTCVEGSLGAAVELDSGCISVGYGWFSIGLRGTLRKAGKCTGSSCAAPTCGDDGSRVALTVCSNFEESARERQQRQSDNVDFNVSFQDPELNQTTFRCLDMFTVELEPPFVATNGAGNCKYSLKLGDVSLSQEKGGYLLATKAVAKGAFNGTIACASNIVHVATGSNRVRNITDVPIECASVLDDGTLSMPLDTVVEAPTITGSSRNQAAWIDQLSCNASACVLTWFADSTMQFANLADGSFRPSEDGTYETVLNLNEEGFTVGATTKVSNFTATLGEDFGADVMNASETQGCEPSPTPPFTPATPSPTPTTQGAAKSSPLADMSGLHEDEMQRSVAFAFQPPNDECTECDPNIPDGGRVALGASVGSKVEIGGWPVPVIGGEVKVEVSSQVSGSVQRPSCQEALNSGTGICESSTGTETTAAVAVTLGKIGTSLSVSWKNSVQKFQCLECPPTPAPTQPTPEPTPSPTRKTEQPTPSPTKRTPSPTVPTPSTPSPTWRHTPAPTWRKPKHNPTV